MNAARLGVGLAAALALAAVGWFFFAGRSGVVSPRPAVVSETTAPDKLSPAPPPTPAIETGPTGPAISPAAFPLTASQIRLLGDVANGLANGDPAASRALAALRAWAARDPVACARWVLENLQGASRQRGLEEAVASWVAQQGPRAVLDWLDQQDPTRFDAATTAGAYALALATLAEQDGTGAVAWLRGHPNQGSASNWSNVLGAWADHHSTEALQWIMTVGNLEPGLRETILPNLLTSFRDPGTTDRLLRGASAAATEDALVRAARATVQADPEYSLGLARQIQGQAARDEAVARALGRWLETDPVTARSFATRAGLPLPSSSAEAAQGAALTPLLETTSPDAPPVPPKP